MRVPLRRRAQWLRWRMRPRHDRAYIDLAAGHHIACDYHRALLERPTLAFASLEVLREHLFFRCCEAEPPSRSYGV